MSFKNFNFNRHIANILTRLGHHSPTPIQHQAITPILQGRDILGLAQTGTGKTAAFCLPILQNFSTRQSKEKSQALILSPTRELADQTACYIKEFSDRLKLKCEVVYGGVSRNAQVRRLQKGVDILVACPGRLIDLVRAGDLDLSNISVLVLDEADQMLDKGFLPDIRQIVSRVPSIRQTLIFSATMPVELGSLVERLLDDPVKISIDHKKPKASISHQFFQVDDRAKTTLLSTILQEKDTAQAIVFTRTKHKAKRLALQLSKKGFKATSLQGNLSQNRRQQALDGFKTGLYTILVATDIAARGIDVSGITHVINFDMPDTTEAYTHRTGRTGRASRSGQAITFATDNDRKMLNSLKGLFKGKVSCYSGAEDPACPQTAVTKAGKNSLKPFEMATKRRRKGGISRGNRATAC